MKMCKKINGDIFKLPRVLDELRFMSKEFWRIDKKETIYIRFSSVPLHSMIKPVSPFIMSFPPLPSLKHLLYKNFHLRLFRKKRSFVELALSILALLSSFFANFGSFFQIRLAASFCIPKVEFLNLYFTGSDETHEVDLTEMASNILLMSNTNIARHVLKKKA